MGPPFLSCLVLFCQKVFARLELGDFFRLDFDFFTIERIAAFPCSPLAYRECTKTNQCQFVPTFQSLGNPFKKRVERGCSGYFCDFCIICNFGNKFCFSHKKLGKCLNELLMGRKYISFLFLANLFC